ncbi:MAG: hypothetical protein K6E51_03515 [Treponema sp.]|nr:hypothetical protein [Treponema sp.]
MIRVEIIANQSVQDEIVNNLVKVIPDFYYSIIPLVHGRGKDSFKLGTTTWPETNFILIAYIQDDAEHSVQTVIEYIKKKFTTEGIKLFVLHDHCSTEKK